MPAESVNAPVTPNTASTSPLYDLTFGLGGLTAAAGGAGTAGLAAAHFAKPTLDELARRIALSNPLGTLGQAAAQIWRETIQNKPYTVLDTLTGPGRLSNRLAHVWLDAISPRLEPFVSRNLPRAIGTSLAGLGLMLPGLIHFSPSAQQRWEDTPAGWARTAEGIGRAGTVLGGWSLLPIIAANWLNPSASSWLAKLRGPAAAGLIAGALAAAGGLGSAAYARHQAKLRTDE